MPPETNSRGVGYPTNVEALETFLEEKIQKSTIPGLSVAVVRSDGLVWARGFGFADLASLAPATPATLYLWFSMTKIVTATAALRLAERGNLDLDAPVIEYFADFSAVSQPGPLTVRHLLSHSSGLAPTLYRSDGCGLPVLRPPISVPSSTAYWPNTAS